MLTDLQKKAAQAIINIFETGRAQGEYGQVTLLAGDPGQLTYGRSQTTLASGNLYLLIKAYCATPGAEHAGALAPYLGALERRDGALNQDMALRALLRHAGDDPAMRDCQDAFFDRVYWQPAAVAADRLGLATALGVTTVYDGTVHGSWGNLRDMTTASFGPPSAIGEKAWVGHYIDTRRNWLATHSVVLLHNTVYRMDALKAILQSGNWDFTLPFTVRGVRLDEATLGQPGAVRVSAQIAEERLLSLRTPYLQGEDVRKLQAALGAAGFAVTADGVFGPATADALKAYQAKAGLVADAVAGPATRAALGL
jgi:chitosanase